jgi:restriction system protein
LYIILKGEDSMAIWLIRAGASGEYEQKFLQDCRIYAAFTNLSVNLDILPDRDSLSMAMSRTYPGATPEKIINYVKQVWPFAHDIKTGDLVLMPLKSQPAVAIGEVTGHYRFEHAASDPFYHWRTVDWIAEAVPRSYFGPDLLYTLGSCMTICPVNRNNAEERLAAMRANDWKPEPAAAISHIDSSNDETCAGIDLEAVARDQLAQLVAARFQGQGLVRLVEAILKAGCYGTCQNPDAAADGVDFLAAAGTIGFAAPHLCVAVKSEDDPVGWPSVEKLLGAITKFGAKQGLFVSWSGFKNDVHKKLPASFFRLRLWTQKELMEELFANYDKLDDAVKARLPLRRIWTAAAQQ